MKIDSWPGVAILRKCRCCLRWRRIDQFSHLGKLCKACVDTNVSTGANTIARARGIVITDKGRALLRELERPAA